jgi:hypothetical protein
LECIDEDPTKRPTAKEVVQRLSKLAAESKQAAVPGIRPSTIVS